MYCKHCGEEIENDSKFCSVCGTKQKQVTGEGTKTPVLKYKRIKGVYRFFVLAILLTDIFAKVQGECIRLQTGA